jgi:AcrR family transcriptional regulator
MTTERPGAQAASRRGLRTQARLLDAAERLWGERGVEGVSLREIRIAAGQRNSSALQFHFTNRDGLLLALVQRHLPRVAAIQQDLHAALTAAGRGDDLAGLVEVLVRPTAEYLRLGPSERAWVKISAERFARPETGLADLADHAQPVGIEVGTRIYERLARDLDADIAVERLLSVLAATQHMCADRARLEDTPPAAVARQRLPFDRWLANLLDMALGALAAPPAFSTGGGRRPRGQPRSSRSSR